MTRFCRLTIPCFLLFALGSGVAAAGEPVIKGGREVEILALFAPYQLAGEVVPGWTLDLVTIRGSHIDVGALGPDGKHAHFQLVRQDQAPILNEHTASFAVVRTERARQGPAVPAVDALIAAVRANDGGDFWGASEEWRIDLGAAAKHLGARLWAWALDGVVWIGLLAALLVVLAVRGLGGAPRFVCWGLPLVLVTGAVLRLLIAVPINLGVWPYGRLNALAEQVYEGPAVGLLGLVLDRPLYLADVVAWTGLVLAVLAPLAVFVHARYLLGEPRIALAAAALMALLPLHIRFSRSEVAFIPSIVISALAFILTHVALRDRSRAWRIGATIALPVVIAGMIQLRPLNVLFVPLLVAVPLFIRPRQVPRWRMVLVAALCGVGGMAVGLYEFIGTHQQTTAEVLQFHVLSSAVLVVLDPRQNTLFHPGMTPTVFLLLAIVGAVTLWRQHRRKAVFAVAWILLFQYFHACVNPQEIMMQARYHLHLAVPFVLLAAAGVEPLWRWHRPVAAVLGAVALASPLLALPFERDVDYNEMHEYAFVRSVRDRIPPDCTVLEYTGWRDGTPMPRFERMGQRADGGVRGTRYRVVDVSARERKQDPISGDPLSADARQILADPPVCLWFYEGIPCFSHKEPTEAIAPACGALHDALALTPRESVTFDSRLYDHELSRGFAEGTDELTLTLYEVAVR